MAFALLTLGQIGQSFSDLGDMPLAQKITTITIASSLLLLVLEMVRTRRLREEYSWLWILTALGLLFVILWFEALKFLTGLIGAGSTSSTIFFLGHVFLVLVCIQFSVRLSKLTEQSKNLAQQLAIMKEDIRRLKTQNRRRAAPKVPTRGVSDPEARAQSSHPHKTKAANPS